MISCNYFNEIRTFEELSDSACGGTRSIENSRHLASAGRHDTSKATVSVAPARGTSEVGTIPESRAIWYSDCVPLNAVVII